MKKTKKAKKLKPRHWQKTLRQHELMRAELLALGGAREQRVR